jgi:hypothetical protein
LGSEVSDSELCRKIGDLPQRSRPKRRKLHRKSRFFGVLLYTERTDGGAFL